MPINSIFVSADVTRVGIVIKDKLIDQEFPSYVPVNQLIAMLIPKLQSRFPDMDFDFTDTGSWTFSTLGNPPLPAHLTLDELKITENTLLVLRPTSPEEISLPLFEDIRDATAEVSKNLPVFRAENAETLAMILTPMLFLYLAGVAVFFYLHKGSYLPSIASALLGLITWTFTLLSSKNIARWKLTASLEISSLIILTTSGFLLSQPLSYQTNLFSSSNFLTGFVILLVFSALDIFMVATIIPLNHVLFTVGFIGALASTVEVIFNINNLVILICVAIFCVIGYYNIPKISVRVSKIDRINISTDEEDYLPVVPVINKNLFDKVAPLVPDITKDLTKRAEQAQQTISALVSAFSIVLAVTAPWLISPVGGYHWQRLVTAISIIGIMFLLPRIYSDIWSCLAAYVFSFFTTVAVAYRWYKQNPDHHHIIVLSVVAIILITFIVIEGFFASHVSFPPMSRRLIQIFGFILLVVLVFFGAWATGVYAFARGGFA